MQKGLLYTLFTIRPLYWSRIDFIGLLSSVMLHELCRTVKFTGLLKVGSRIQDFAHL